jgi:hypothetical protein
VNLIEAPDTPVRSEVRTPNAGAKAAPVSAMEFEQNRWFSRLLEASMPGGRWKRSWGEMPDHVRNAFPDLVAKVESSASSAPPLQCARPLIPGEDGKTSDGLNRRAQVSSQVSAETSREPAASQALVTGEVTAPNAREAIQQGAATSPEKSPIRGERTDGVTLELRTSDAWMRRNVHEQRILDQLIAAYQTGQANGHLVARRLDIARYVSARKISGAIARLEARGLIAVVAAGIGMEPSRYALTWLPVEGMPATNLWRQEAAVPHKPERRKRRGKSPKKSAA